ncbi:MAG: glycine--tRNA ligase subunit beta [Gammaproteobacteria bacterium]|nr:glycine--tRNA ligase subunit beta [Gammaproteobacteria bacterium]
MSTHDFLVEIGTEELPPKALKSLAAAFQQGIEAHLNAKEIAFTGSKLFAAPRRLALRLEGLAAEGNNSKVEKFGPYVNVALDADGKPTKAAEGFARSNGIEFDQVGRITDEKGERLYFAQEVAGAKATDELPVAINDALNKLPIPKRMRWGSSRIEFVRPVHWVLMLLDNKVIEANILGVQSNYFTKGHRFHANREIAVTSPSAYESILKEQGKVLADYAERKAMIRSQVEAEGEKLGGTAVIDEDLLDEVTSLNEWPTALAGNFDKAFLEVPAEALISSMKEHQKYFHVVDKSGKLMPNFITICNIESKDPQQVIEGNEKVIRPRLSDAKFFWDTDRKQTLESRFEKLDTVVWVQKLGTLKDKSERLMKLAAQISGAMGGDVALAERAGKLAKTDLLSDMVYEFTDLQGLAGSYYAQHDGEHAEVCAAMNEQYMPAFSGDNLPATVTGTALALADRLDSLVGLFGIGQIPTGGKDPFALRRASLGVLRLLVEKQIDIDLSDLIDWAIDNNWPTQLNADSKSKLIEYMLDRFSAWYQDENIPAVVFQAVRAKGITQPLDVNKRVQAVFAFSKLDSAEALAAANKRVSNILTKNDAFIDAPQINEALLQEDAEKVLAKALAEKAQAAAPLFEQGQYAEYLTALTPLRNSIDAFFDNVMVMADDEAVKQNRLALLNQLRNLFLKVADISHL